MNRFIAALLLAGLTIVAPMAASAEKAVCLVCKVKEGATHAETVEASRTHDGIRYGFCSEKCAKEFDADPMAFLPPKFPRPAPALNLTDLEGKALRSSLEGNVVLVDFWATWCAPCLKSMPELQALHDRYSGRGFVVVGISIDEKTSATDQVDVRVKKFISKKKITYPIAIDSQTPSVWEQYRVKAVPAAFLLDRRGQIVAQWSGKPPKAAEIEKELTALLRDPG